MIRLGPFNIQHPFILAPMAGITDSPFRRLMRRMGSALVVSELISANGLSHGGRKTLEFIKFHEEERIIGLQLFGDNPEFLVKAAGRIEVSGAEFVDINLGCPVPKVVNKGGGCAMCGDLVKLGKTLKKIVESVKLPVTVKIRTGWDQNSINVHEVVSAVTDAGVAWIAVHGRTRSQGYSGLADWDLIGEVKARSRIPIIGNGDITTPELAVERYRTYGVDAVMIGRAALRNPFIFEQASALLQGQTYEKPDCTRYLSLLDEQKALLDEMCEPNKILFRSRKFLAWYSTGYPGCHDFRRKVFHTNEVEELWTMAREFFSTNVYRRDMNFLATPFIMGGHG